MRHKTTFIHSFIRARIRSFRPPQLHFLPFYHNLELDKDCLVTQFCLFCIVTSLKILASYTLLPLLMYSCKFQLRNSIFIILYTITCALNDQSCRCAIKQHSFIHSFIRARIRSFRPPQLHFLPFYHNLELDKDCLVTQFCLFCIVTSLKILASYTLLPLLMYSCKFQLRNSIFIILYTITCALNDQSCRCAIKQHSFIHSFLVTLVDL